MAFDSIIPDGFPELYDDQWRLQLQQLTSRLAPYVNTDIVNGEFKRYQRLGKAEARQITERFGDTNPDELPVEYRLLYVDFAHSAHIVDRREAKQLGQIGGPQNAILRSQLAAAARDMDKTLIDGIRGSVASGKNGTTPIPLPASQQIAVDYRNSGSGNTGMTFDKLLQTSTLFGLGNVMGQDVEGMSPGCVVLSHKQVQDLLTEEKLTSADYGIRRLMDGQVVSVFGMALKAVDASLLPHNTGTDIRSCYAFAREEVVFGIAENPQSWVDELPTKRHDVQIRTEWGWGCTRLSEEGVIEIACDESP